MVQTKSDNFDSIQGWMPSRDCLEGWSAGFQITEKSEMRSCGCGVKIDLVEVLYPALQHVQLGGGAKLGLGRRVDAHVMPGALLEHTRIVVKAGELEKRREELSSKIAATRADVLVELFSSSSSYYENPQGLKDEISHVIAAKMNLLHSVKDKGGTLTFGKGHSILAGGDLHVFDLLQHGAGAGYSVSNNDTIITADSRLKHASPISVFTAINNALNDLFLMAVHEELTIFPVYDGNTEEVAAIRAALDLYARFYRERGVSLQVEDRGPLGQGTQMVGATVVGRARHELPSIAGMLPGQKIFATRHLGDLSLLSWHRSLLSPKKPHAELDDHRWHVLQHFTTPNFLVAKVLRRYLPDLGEKLDPTKHLTYSGDVSGPGLAVLEEAAQASGVNVLLRDLKFLNEGSLRFYRRNQTSSTNGPIVFAAQVDVARQIAKDLADIGLEEVWEVGEVKEKSSLPTVLLDSRLEARYSAEDPRTDLFSPEVHFGPETDVTKKRLPVFQRYRFV